MLPKALVRGVDEIEISQERNQITHNLVTSYDRGSRGEIYDKGKVFRKIGDERDLKSEHVSIITSKEVSLKKSQVNQKSCRGSESENSDIKRKSGHAPPKFYKSLKRSTRKKQCHSKCSEIS